MIQEGKNFYTLKKFKTIKKIEELKEILDKYDVRLLNRPEEEYL